jgi:cytochrome c oxidase cbb3-type subunit III
MPTKIEKDSLSGRDTTGHEWDGVKELNTPLPTWWVYSFYATIVFSLVYCVLYPAIPSLSDHTEGTLGYTNRGALSRELAEQTQGRAKFVDRIRVASFDQMHAVPRRGRRRQQRLPEPRR